QVRLLRVLQDHAVELLGATTPMQVNVRVLAATNKDLSKSNRLSYFVAAA
ncbi:MAG: sigma 54-interacting transcriptional regulator, partial [Syntrophaceae bacterium]|nr:sigma 54-interacting transcriptional regulator [Syntrophaceae bacterium]